MQGQLAALEALLQEKLDLQAQAAASAQEAAAAALEELTKQQAELVAEHKSKSAQLAAKHTAQLQARLKPGAAAPSLFIHLHSIVEPCSPVIGYL